MTLKGKEREGEITMKNKGAGIRLHNLLAFPFYDKNKKRDNRKIRGLEDEGRKEDHKAGLERRGRSKAK